MYSYVTLVTNPDFAKAAIALAKSLKKVKAQMPLTVMTTPHMIEHEHIQKLQSLGCPILEVQPLPLSADFCTRHSRQKVHENAPFTKGEKPQFHNPLDNFLKLRLWEMEAYERVVFLDADCIVLQNIDNLFGFPEFSGAPNLYESLSDMHRLNSGVFVAKPSCATFEDMLEKLDQKDIFWQRTDQTFLQSYFPHWHNLPYIYNCLQYVWFNMPELWQWESIKVIHYQYEKPWQIGHAKADKLKPLIDLWHEIYES